MIPILFFLIAQAPVAPADAAESLPILPGLLPVIINSGIGGLMLYWFAIRLERILETNRKENSAQATATQEAMYSLAAAQMLTLIRSRQTDGALVEQAQALVDKMSKAQVRKETE